MKRILFLTALLVVVMAKAQLPTDFRSEQIYLNPEKHSYKPGRYRLLVDVFTDTGVQSYEHPFEVVE